MEKLDRDYYREQHLTQSPDEVGPPSVGLTIGELAREAGVTLRALRFYQSKGLLTPQRNGTTRLFTADDRDRLALILQGKRLGFTLHEIREMLAARDRGNTHMLPINRKKCVEQINLLERQRREIEAALGELRRIYTGMFIATSFSRAGRRRQTGSGLTSAGRAISSLSRHAFPPGSLKTHVSRLPDNGNRGRRCCILRRARDEHFPLAVR